MEIVSLLLKAGADPNIVDKVCQCYVYGVPAENNTLGELDGHVHCTEGLVPLWLSLILGNQRLMGKAKLDFACYQEYIRRESIELCVNKHCVQYNMTCIM